jgi:hypothetical protein
MLDFYFIDDHQANPGPPIQGRLEFIGGLDELTFQNLQDKKIIDKRFDYYSRFRLATVLIKQIRQNILNTKMQDDIDVKKLLCLLDAAEQKQCGLIAYGD